MARKFTSFRKSQNTEIDLGIVLWFIIFGLSFLWKQQGTAFVVLYSIAVLLLTVAMIVVIAKVTSKRGVALPMKPLEWKFLGASVALGNLAGSMVGAWLAALATNVSFVAAFQILTFGLCIASYCKPLKLEITLSKKQSRWPY